MASISRVLPDSRDGWRSSAAVGPPGATFTPALSRRQWTIAFAAVAGLAVLATALVTRASLGTPTRDSTIAVGFIREDGPAASFRTSRVLTDMIATDLARV